MARQYLNRRQHDQKVDIQVLTRMTEIRGNDYFEVAWINSVKMVPVEQISG